MRAIAAAVLVLALAGCASGPSAPPADGGAYGSVEELRDAYVAAGGDCDDWEQDNVVDAAAESGTCGSDTVLSTYVGANDRDEVVSNIKALGELDIDFNLLVGANWIINSEDVADVRAGLGGTLVSSEID